MTQTATCADCDVGWRGPHAHDHGGEHETATGHVVWYDEIEGDEPDTGPFAIVWEQDGPFEAAVPA